jgi:hypothetical protein
VVRLDPLDRTRDERDASGADRVDHDVIDRDVLLEVGDVREQGGRVVNLGMGVERVGDPDVPVVDRPSRRGGDPGPAREVELTVVERPLVAERTILVVGVGDDVGDLVGIDQGQLDRAVRVARVDREEDLAVEHEREIDPLQCLQAEEDPLVILVLPHRVNDRLNARSGRGGLDESLADAADEEKSLGVADRAVVPPDLAAVLADLQEFRMGVFLGGVCGCGRDTRPANVLAAQRGGRLAHETAGEGNDGSFEVRPGEFVLPLRVLERLFETHGQLRTGVRGLSDLLLPPHRD